MRKRKVKLRKIETVEEAYNRGYRAGYEKGKMAASLLNSNTLTRNLAQCCCDKWGPSIWT